jgi:hypothetical protein
MARNTVTEQFRQTATEEQWRELVSDHDTLPKEQFEEKYHFSWSSIMNDAAERGYYEKKRKHFSSTLPQRNPDGSEVFFVAAQPSDLKKVSRSVQLSEDIYARLQSLEHDNGQYTHSSILNQLLDDALKKYGY